MLEIRPSFECCDKDLAPDSLDALICSFECTFCTNCVEYRLGGRCPNCGGTFNRRPTRAADQLVKFPTSFKRVYKPKGCGG